MKLMSDSKHIFIVGSSRSGTTMMGRILSNNSKVFTFRELHFFGKIWSNSIDTKLSKKDQLKMMSRLLCIQKKGIFNYKDYSEFNSKSRDIIDSGVSDPLKLYSLFLEYVTEKNGAIISCEQTPSNLYYLKEILAYFPNAKVINLVRDQRDVLLSQKNKWRRRFLGANAIPLFESFRSYVNYHPILTAKVWNSSLNLTYSYINHPNVKVIKFEKLLKDSEDCVKDICNFLNIEFNSKMLKVPLLGSSTQLDSKSKMVIDKEKISKWKNGGLNQSEIYLSQIFSSTMMDQFGYKKKSFLRPPLLVVFYLISFPFKLVLAFFFNLHRVSSINEIIKKRFF